MRKAVHFIYAEFPNVLIFDRKSWVGDQALLRVRFCRFSRSGEYPVQKTLPGGDYYLLVREVFQSGR